MRNQTSYPEKQLAILWVWSN